VKHVSVVFAALVVLGITVAVVGAVIPLFARDPVQQRLAQFRTFKIISLEEAELEQPFSERVLRPLVQKLAAGMERTNRRQDTRQRERQTTSVQQKLNLAGNPNRWSPSDFLGVKALAAITVGAVIFVLVTAAGQPAFAIFAAAGGALIGFVAPEMYLTQLIGKRQHEIARSLPDAIDLLVICVEAGLGFDAALARLVQKSDNALTREFGRGLAELRVGRPRKEALKDIIARTEVPDLANFVSAIIQADSLGVSVTMVLGVQADQMRTLRRQRAEEQAGMAPVKMLIPMLLFIFPALCVVLLGPIWPQMVAATAATGP
jgi:tight adherence protein C